MPDFGPEYRKNRGRMACAPGRRRAARAWTLARKAGPWGFVEDAAVRTILPLAGLALAVLMGWGPAASAAESTVYTTDQLRNALGSASAGDRIYVAPGYYNQLLWVQNVHGQPGNMIEVVALDPANRPVFEEHASSVFTFYQCSYVMVDGVIVQGAGTAAEAGNNIMFTYSDHMILKNSISRNIVNTGNSDGTKFNHSNNVLMYNCTVSEWGEGGAGMDGMISHSNLYMRNTFTFPSLATGDAAHGIMPKGAAYHHGIYKNRFIDGSSRGVCFGGSGGATGPEIYDSVAMGNVIEAGEAALAYVSCTDCEFSYNTVVNPEKWVMRVQKEGVYETDYNTFRRNLVHYGPFLQWGSVQGTGGTVHPETFTYEANYWYKWDNPAASIPSLPGGEIDPAGGVDPQLDADHRPWYGPAMEYGAHAPAMEAEFEQYAGWFQWAWDQAQLFEPKAEPGGPYEIGPGGTITLDAGGSQAGAGSYGPYSFDSLLWDINRDGTPDAAGLGADVTYDDLLLLGMGFGAHTVELKAAVTNEYNTIWDLAFAELSIVNHPALSGDGNADNVVDGLDYVVWSNHYEECGHPAWSDGGWAVGNYTEDDCVDGLDYVVWSNNYLQGLPASPGAVPEPTSALLLAVGLACLRRRPRG